MDELNQSFGRLSTNAAEWTPQAASSSATAAVPQQQQPVYHATAMTAMTTTTTQSDLSANSVKEFVPGRGWSPAPQQQQQQQQLHQPQLAPPISPPRTQAPEASNLYSRATIQSVPSTGSADTHDAIYETTLPAGPSSPHPPSFRGLHSLGLPDDLWRYHKELSLEKMRQMEPSDPRHKAVPVPYCNAFCLDSATHRGRSSFGYPCSTFQVTNREDGNLYCLRRFDSVRSVSPKIAATVAERWRSATQVQEHPGVTAIYQCFVAQRAVFFVHQYVPGARTLRERLSGPLSEPVLWSCIAQLVSAMRTIHTNNLAVRSMGLNHVLSCADPTGSSLRLYFNCLGIVDALEFEARKHVQDLQRQDVRDLGRLILSLATGTEVTAATDNDTLARCEAFLAQNYSRDLHNIAMTLIRSAPRPPSIVDVSRAIAQRSFDEQDAAYRALDRTERALAGEYESGRALRLLLKLGFVNERPEFGPNRRWSQSGDCYLLTLFRDFVFHQADGAGNPVMDLGHIITALNKLDARDEEKIVLSSRDGKSLMVVSYADVATCLDDAYGELCSGSVPPSALQY